MKRILFVGAVNENALPKGGEEYKNQLILDKLKRESIELIYMDTIEWKKSPFLVIKLIFNVLLLHFDSVVISASSVSTYRLLNFIQWIKPSLLNKTTYLVIGGYFPEGIRSKRFDWRSYKNLKKIVVEGNLLLEKVLANSELSNVVVVPNFKTFPNLVIETSNTLVDTFRFVFVGRISMGKGVLEILDAITKLNKTNKEFVVDFYGPIEEEFDFDSEKANYCGFLDFQNHPEKAYSTLSKYDCLLFPTYWKGEGFPGVIIDAFIAGLPVIATDWNMNSEIVEDGINGFIIPPKDAHSLANKMMWVMENKDILKETGTRNQERANDYHIDQIWPNLFEIIK